ncbi:hypothetical protein [Sphingobacterium daejeonense]|uniref:hypothetical protein n=1 Tax=Sphingobacterium daejeonense TaxID=371142 RepID=UPI0010C46DA7|nr:hypothetical protein [Sphingobacterium daejeonense]VTQ06921.1 Uncharacterised protein [Sphingobacterium daejeonense]
MDIYTEEPGIQFYSGNFMADNVTLKNGAKDSFRTGLCLGDPTFSQILQTSLIFHLHH